MQSSVPMLKWARKIEKVPVKNITTWIRNQRDEARTKRELIPLLNKEEIWKEILIFF
jgi:hypothetical protein